MAQKSALIVKFGRIGDVIMAIPAARSLYEQGYAIDWACGSAVRSLLECYSWIRVIPVDDTAILFGQPLERVRGVGAFWRKVVSKRYSLCATIYYDRRYQLLTLPVRAERKLMLSYRMRQTTLLAGRHQTDEFGRIFLQEEDGCREQSLRPVRPDRLPPSPLPGKTAARRIAMVPGGVKHLVREKATGRMPEQALRRWPIASWVTLAQELSDRGWEVVLLGAAEDDWIRPYFEHLACTICLGTLALPEVISVCDACDAVITHDTGPLHLAGLSDACLVGIFGPTDPASRVPRRPFSVGIWGGQGFACRPCYDGRDFAPCTFNGCMHQVSPEMVLRELDRLLVDRSRGVPSPWRIVHPDGS